MAARVLINLGVDYRGFTLSRGEPSLNTQLSTLHNSYAFPPKLT